MPDTSSLQTAAPELRMTRVFDAPKRLVFEAWSKAEYLSRWFTPSPLTTPSCEVDFRPGGVFRLVMRMPDGIEFPMDARFGDIVDGERIVFSARIHGGLDVQTTVTFAEHDGKTTLDVHQVYSHTSDATRGAHAGWTLTLDQLAAHVRGRAGAVDPTLTREAVLSREIVLSRVFDAPRALVFRAWTDPSAVAHWFGPKGFTCVTHEMDVRIGGKWRFDFFAPDGTKYDNRVVYLEISPNDRLVFDHGTDKDDDATRFRVTVTFDEQSDGKTVVTLRQLHPTKQQRDAGIGFGAVEFGYQTLDKLGEWLKN